MKKNPIDMQNFFASWNIFNLKINWTEQIAQL